MFQEFLDRVINFFTNDIATYYFSYIIQFVLFFTLFYLIFKVLKINKSQKFIALVVFFVIMFGISIAFSKIESYTLMLVILMIALVVFAMFHTEIKRTLLDSNVKKSKKEKVNVSGVDFII